MILYVVVGLIAFGNLSTHHFELDDLAYLEDLNQIRQAPSTIFSPERRLPGRPATDLVLLFIQTIYKNNPAAFHIGLVFCHLIATILLTFTLYKTGLNQELSLISGFFFFINLAHFRAIQWISCTAYPLALIFGCIGILAYIAYRETSRGALYSLSIFGFTFAILSHPAAVAFPIFLIYLAWQNKQPLNPVVALGGIAFIVLIGLLRFFPDVPQTEHATAVFQWHILDFLQHGLWYLGRLWVSTFTIFPDMSTTHTFDQIFGILAAIGIILLFIYRVFPIAHWGIWMILCLAVFITNPYQTHFESGPSRHLYFASVGSSVLLAWQCQKLSLILPSRSSWLPKISLAFLITTVSVLCLIGIKKSETFAYILSARTYLVINQQDKASQLFERAVAQAPKLVSASMYEKNLIINLGRGQFLNHSMQQAIAHYPNNPSIIALQMLYKFQEKDLSEHNITDRIVVHAQQYSKQTQELIAISCFNLGSFYATKSQYKRAQKLLQSALKLKPRFPEAVKLLGQV